MKTTKRITNEAAVRRLVFDEIDAAGRSTTITRLDGAVVATLDAVARRAIRQVVARAVETHPSGFRTLAL